MCSFKLQLFQTWTFR